MPSFLILLIYITDILVNDVIYRFNCGGKAHMAGWPAALPTFAVENWTLCMLSSKSVCSTPLLVKVCVALSMLRNTWIPLLYIEGHKLTFFYIY